MVTKRKILYVKEEINRKEKPFICSQLEKTEQSRQKGPGKKSDTWFIFHKVSILLNGILSAQYRLFTLHLEETVLLRGLYLSLLKQQN